MRFGGPAEGAAAIGRGPHQGRPGSRRKAPPPSRSAAASRMKSRSVSTSKSFRSSGSALQPGCRAHPRLKTSTFPAVASRKATSASSCSTLERVSERRRVPRRDRRLRRGPPRLTCAMSPRLNSGSQGPRGHHPGSAARSRLSSRYTRKATPTPCRLPNAIAISRLAYGCARHAPGQYFELVTIYDQSTFISSAVDGCSYSRRSSAA